MISDTVVFPVVGSQRELDVLTPRAWGECVSCIETRQRPGGAGENQEDFVDWAKGHARINPTHTRFRRVESTNFQVLLPRSDPIDRIP